jgi:tetratricopeptide (TPR) repeat protein
MMLAALALIAAAAAPPNLLLVSIDTLRADRVGCYGYAAIETPALDRLAREGLLLEDATVHVPQTRPSHASMLTGLYPFTHGVRDNFSPPLDGKVPTLAALLKARGYDTAAFIGGYPLAASSGLNRGFDLYDDALGTGSAGGALMAERVGAEVVDRALRWLGGRRRPFFAFVHLYDPHTPYEPPRPFSGRYPGRPYDGEVAYADAQLGRLMAFLDSRGLRGTTLVVATSDHGEGLGDHGEDEHLVFVYESTLSVPLLMAWPGTLPAGRRVGGQFRTVDLMPTLLHLMGVPPAATDGASRASELRGGRSLPDNESYAESLYGQLHFRWAPLRALRAEGWKYIEAPRPELYHLRQDAAERTNVLDVRGQVATRMRERLATYGSTAPAAAIELPADAGAVERLVSLGYVGAGGGPSTGVKGADPKDMIAGHQAYSRDVQKGLRLFRAGDVDGSLEILERLARQEAVAFEVPYFLGKALLRKRRYADAVKSLEDARAILPRFAPLYVDLAQAFRLQGKPREARAAVNRGLEIAEKNAALWEEGGLAAQQMGDVAAAQAALETARALDPGSVRARLALSAIYRGRGDRAAATTELREAVRRNPRSASAWNALGVLLGESGSASDAESAFRKGLEADPADADLLYNLADLLMSNDRPRDALPLLEKLETVAPAFEEGREALARVRRDLAGPGTGALRLRLIRVRERAEAEGLSARLASGADFGAEARAVSIDPSAAAGGSLGVVRLADLAEPLRSAAAGLEPGTVSAVLETAEGYVILRRDP